MEDPTSTLENLPMPAPDSDFSSEEEKGASATTTVDKHRSSKVDRRNARKFAKAIHMVSKATGLRFSPEPNQWVVIWGVGTAHHQGKAEILAYFKPTPVEVRLFVDAPYVFVRLASEEDAVALKEAFDGKEFSQKSNEVERRVIHVAFIDKSEEIPEEGTKLIEPFGRDPPEGLVIIPEFISVEEEKEIMRDLRVDQKPGNSN